MRYHLLALIPLLGLEAPALAPQPAAAQQWNFGGVGIPIVCAYNASPPTVATGKFVYAQCNSGGTLLGGGGGGGGAVTLASGAVASGAYSAGSMAAGAFVSGSFVAGALADGAITTLGTEGDTAWTSGSGTAIALLKAIANHTNLNTTSGWLLDAIDTPITAGTGGNSTTINSAASEVIAENVGTTNVAFCGLGGTATNNYKSLQPNGGWFVWQVNGATQVTCITNTATTQVNVQTGSGVAVGTGGGGSGAVNFTWPGTAALTAYGTTPSGTVPAVNAFITNGNANVTSNAQEAASPITPILQAAGGLTPKILNALANAGVAVKGSAGQLFMIDCYNPNATVGYVQAYDAVTITGTPKISIGVPATSHAGFTLSGIGVQFATGIEVQTATTATGSTALGTAMDCNAAYN